MDKLKVVRKNKGCESAGANLKQSTDSEVYKRADEGVLNSARVIERAKAGKLVDGSGASCSELEKIINVDKKNVLNNIRAHIRAQTRARRRRNREKHNFVKMN